MVSTWFHIYIKKKNFDFTFINGINLVSQDLNQPTQIWNWFPSELGTLKY